MQITFAQVKAVLPQERAHVLCRGASGGASAHSVPLFPQLLLIHNASHRHLPGTGNRNRFDLHHSTLMRSKDRKAVNHALTRSAFPHAAAGVPHNARIAPPIARLPS